MAKKPKKGSAAAVVQQLPPANAKVYLGDEIETDVNGGKRGTLTHISTERPTVEKSMTAAHLNPDEWVIERVVNNEWQGFAKMSDGSIKVVTLYQLKVWLRPNKQLWAVDAANIIARKYQNFKPVYNSWQPPKDTTGDWLAVVGLFDAHFGKLAWDGETNNNYDLNIAKRDYLTALQQMLEQASPYKIACWRFSIGQDVLHIDSSANTTTAGTPQDVDGRFAKIVVALEETLIESIDKCLRIAPVLAEYDASNHDRHAAWQVSRAIYRHYAAAGMGDVQVNTDWIGRKYIHWGQNLLGIAHGHEEKLARYTSLMPQEQPEAWAQSNFREWLLGHLHSEKVLLAKEAADQDGVSVRHLRSLSGTSSWEYNRGYLSDRAAELHLYHRDGLQQIRMVFRIPKGRARLTVIDK